MAANMDEDDDYIPCEFVVPEVSVKVITEHLNHIKELFKTVIVFGKPIEDTTNVRKQWIRVLGQYSQECKEYTTALVNPEYYYIMENVVNLSHKDLFEVEKDSHAVLRRLAADPRTLEISGTQLTVVAALSMLEDRMTREDEVVVISPEKNPGSSEDKPTALPMDIDQCDSSTDIQTQKASLYKLGFNHNFSAVDIDSALNYCDLASVKPEEFLGILKIVASHKSEDYSNSAIVVTSSSDELDSTGFEEVSFKKRKRKVHQNHHLPSQPSNPSVPASASSSLQNQTSPSTSAASVPKSYARSAAVLTNSPIKKNSHLRYIVIDGSNVARGHLEDDSFSTKGLKICIDYFKDRGHTEVIAFVSETVRYKNNSRFLSRQNRALLEKLNKEGLVKFTPARKINGTIVASYEDRFILNLALQMNAVIVSNDQFRDLLVEEKYKTLTRSLLQYVFVGDLFMPPDDPYGRTGPNLNELLMSDPRGSTSNIQRTAIQINTRNPSTSKFQRPASQMNYQNNNNYVEISHQPIPAAKPLLPSRSEEETQELYEHLIQIFPEPSQKLKVQNVLKNHLTETDLTKLTNFCLNALPPE